VRDPRRGPAPDRYRSPALDQPRGTLGPGRYDIPVSTTGLQSSQATCYQRRCRNGEMPRDSKKMGKSKDSTGGGSVAKDYFCAARKAFEQQWTSIIRPFLEGHPIEYAHTLDLTCGRGRNSAMLSQLGVRRMTLVELNPENIYNLQGWFERNR